MLVSTACAALAVVFFGLLAIKLGLARQPARILMVAERAMADLRNPSLDEDAKGALMRRHSLALLGIFLAIVGAVAAAVLAPLFVLWLLDRLRWVSLSEVLKVGSSAWFLVLSTILACACWFGLRKR